ncbi:hypothetical protein EYV94_12110 [Puteibacter caeruleilacunae]|nr:hypothetical protein EYV94_12110 [Puteibacter caeruleilacunae]
MKRSKLFSLALLAFGLCGTMFTSCDDDDDYPFEVIGDAYMKKMDVEGTTKYAAVNIIYANETMSAATVTTPTGEETLEKFYENTTAFWNKTKAEQYVEDIPAVGNYTFKGTNVGQEQLTSVDELTDDEIDLPVITRAEYDGTSSMMELEWDKVADADAYNIKMVDEDGDIVFNGPALNDKAEDYAFGLTSSGWTKPTKAENGKTYTIHLRAYLFDDEATNANWSYNIQCISITTQEVVWNPEQ